MHHCHSLCGEMNYIERLDEHFYYHSITNWLSCRQSEQVDLNKVTFTLKGQRPMN